MPQAVVTCLNAHEGVSTCLKSHTHTQALVGGGVGFEQKQPQQPQQKQPQ